SFLGVSDLDGLAGTASRWLLNVRVSKLGGVLRSLDVVAAASRLGLELVVGAHVGETSLLSRAALTVPRQAGAALVAQEGAFGIHLLTRDPFVPTVMFGKAGLLRVPEDLSLGGAGWGLRLAADQPN